jgi:hypothetical protein
VKYQGYDKGDEDENAPEWENATMLVGPEYAHRKETGEVIQAYVDLHQITHEVEVAPPASTEYNDEDTEVSEGDDDDAVSAQFNEGFEDEDEQIESGEDDADAGLDRGDTSDE